MTEKSLPHPMVRKLVRMKKFAQKGEDRTLVLDYSDEVDMKKLEDEDELVDDDELKTPPAALGSLMSKVVDVLEKEPIPEEPEPTRPPVVVASPVTAKSMTGPIKLPSDLPSTPTPKSPSKKMLIKKPIQKMVEPKLPPPDPVPPPTVVIPERRVRPMRLMTPPREPSPPPRPVTPLPGYIQLCKDEPWFQQYFPNLSENTMPKPWSVASFVQMLVRILRIGDFDTKNHVVDALMQIHSDEGITNADVVYKTLYSVLNHHTTPPSCQEPIQKDFISKTIALLTTLGIYDRDFYMELMVQFMEADSDVRKQVLQVFSSVGLRDPQDLLIKELDSWDVWNLEEKERAGELRIMCRQWLDKWLTSFKIHLKDSIERLKKGGTVMGKTTTRSASRTSTSKGILRKQDEEMIAADGAAKPADSRVVTVTFDHPPDESTIESATFLDAINYFCEMELEKSLEKLRRGTRDADQKNTVLVLPKITEKGALVRLGETHTSKCRSMRETSLAVDMRFPPITDRGRLPAPGQLYGFPPCINLPLKAIYMNPFLSASEKAELDREPVLLMLKTSQKYFVHERSVVPPDPAPPVC